jgi:PTS system fructose-specific IIA component/PTS system nitrogen regulatory IIA component
MRMSHFIVRDAILPALTATTKAGVIEEMVQALHAAGQFPPAARADIVAAVLRREQLGSTGIGRGIAIPHSRHGSIGQLVGTIGLSKADGKVPFDSIDGEPVDVVVLLISPQDQPGPHLRALESVVQAMKDDGFVAALRACQTREQVWDLISGARPAY